METQEANTTSKENGTHKRSASYPGKNLEKTIAFVAQVYANFSTNYVKREEWATIAKMHPNSVARDFAAATQFGLLDRSTDGYKVSKLFIDINQPENPAQKKANILVAFGSPKLYQALIEKFDGRVIPVELPNTLIKHHSIMESVANEAKDIFLESAVFAGALNENNVLNFRTTLSVLQKTQYAEIIDETPNEPDTGKNVPVVLDKNKHVDFSDLNAEYRKVPIHMTKNKIAYFAYPANTSEKDIKIIDHQIKGILLQIQLDHDEEQEKTPASAGG